MGELIDLFWEKEASLRAGVFYSDTELSDMGYGILEPHNWGGLSWQDSFIDITQEEIDNDRYALIYKIVNPLSDVWIGKAFYGEVERGYQIIRKVHKKKEEDELLKIKPLETFGNRTAQDVKESLYEVRTNIEEDTGVEQKAYYDYTLQDIIDKWAIKEEQIKMIKNLDINGEINILLGAGLDFMTVTKIKHGDDNIFPKPLEQFGKKVVGTGEMSWADIQPGGEDYEWANSIAEEVKQIERNTGGKLKFEEMMPFDKYQGPYAYTNLGKVWQIYDESFGPINLFFIEFGMGFGSQRDGFVGDIDLLSAAINNEGTARAVATKNRELGWDNKLNEISLDWDSGIEPLTVFGQHVDFHEGDQVKVISSTYINPEVHGKIGTVKEIIGDFTVVVHFDDVGRHIVTNKIVSMDLHFGPDQLEKVDDTPEIEPLTRFGQVQGSEIEIGDMVELKNGTITTITTKDYVLRNRKETFYFYTNESKDEDDYVWAFDIKRVLSPKPKDIEPLTRFGKLSNRKATYGWAFGQLNSIEIGDIITDKYGIKGRVTKIERQNYIFAVWDDAPGEELYIFRDRIKDIYKSKDIPIDIKPLEVFG